MSVFLCMFVGTPQTSPRSSSGRNSRSGCSSSSRSRSSSATVCDIILIRVIDIPETMQASCNITLDSTGDQFLHNVNYNDANIRENLLYLIYFLSRWHLSCQYGSSDRSIFTIYPNIREFTLFIYIIYL